MSERRANCCRYPEGGGRRVVRSQAKRPRSGGRVAAAAVELDGGGRRTRRWEFGSCIARIGWLITKNDWTSGNRRRAERLASSTRNIRSPIWLERRRSVARI